MLLKNGLRKKTIKAIKTILLIMNNEKKFQELSEIDQFRRLNKEKWDKINLAIELIDGLIEGYKVDRNDFANVGSNSEANLFANMIKELEKIKETLS